MRRVVNALVRGVVVLLVLLVLVLLGGYWYLRQSLPAHDGRLTVTGLAAEIEIIRDADGVPHIMATSKRDALFGLGYVHAQDRLWQMEFQRRIGHGRLSEIFGAAALSQDRFLRTVGFGRAAHRAWEHLSAEARGDTNAYVAGINAFLASHHGRHLPPEFSLLRFEPEPWSGPDVLVWVKMMAWDLGANYSLELLRHDLAAQVGDERASQLMPPYPSDGPTIVDGPAAVSAQPRNPRVAFAPPPIGNRGAPWSSRFARTLASGHPGVAQFLLNSAVTEAVGSNNWVVDGTRTASGKPLLANDPHLGANIPSLWYLAHMSAGAFDVIGATLPGTPAVAIGRNRHIAWGETNVAADVQDLYLEKLDPEGKAAEFKGQWEPLFVIKESIAVQGAEPVALDVRVSRHGPLVSDAINAMNAGDSHAGPPLPPLAFRWTALDDHDTTLESFLTLNEARNWDEFVASMRLFVTPSQNFVYADDNGHIGYLLPGHIPVRQAGDGSRPVPGWTGEYEWTGIVPYDDLPRLFDPPTHTIVTANHRPNPHGDPLHLSLEYPEPYRARQIRSLLESRAKLTPDDFRDIQADTHSRHAEAMLPLLLAAADPTDARDTLATDLLRKWQFDAAGDSTAAAIFEAWFLHLVPALVGDDLGPRVLGAYRGRYSFATRFVTAVLTNNDGSWCDDRRTAGVSESCRHTVTAALHDAVGSLAATLGNDVRAWKWRDVHRAIFPHQGLDAVPALRPILNRSVPSAGDWSTVNVGAVDVERGYDQREIPGYRQIVDLSPANDSRFLDAVGQSGHLLSPRYDDFLSRFSAVRHLPMRVERTAIENGAIGTLRLRPPSPE